MNKNYHKTIRKLRIKKGLVQALVAKKLGIARTSYIAFEQGKRELSLAEATKIAAIFGISLAEVESGNLSNYEKYKEMILAYLRSAGASDGKITKTKLAKLLYLADFAWFYDHLESMSGMQYRCHKYGPVPDMYFRAIEELEIEGDISVDRRDSMLLISESRGGGSKKLSQLSREEKRLVLEIAKKWRDAKTNEIVAFTHKQLPYKLCSAGEFIPYELITQEDPDNVY